jgi:RNA-directed DNA polymerase
VAIGDRVLPQGACTSPAITNVLCRRLDSRLSGIAKSLGFTYSRYADDLIFSSDVTDADVKKMIGMARKIVAEERFIVNDEKTHVMRKNKRQSVTGLIVNAGKAPRVSRDGLRKFRAFLHKTEKIGVAKMSEEIGRDARSYANGMLAWIAMSDANKAAQLKAKHSWVSR